MTFRVWAAARRGADLIVQGTHDTLTDALAQARALAATAIVAIEVPGKRWHKFDETGKETLGPLERTRSVTAPLTPVPRTATGGADATDADEEGGSERRRSRRFTTAGLKGESVSHLGDGTPVRLLDVSADGAQLQLPSRYRLKSGKPVSLRIRGHRGAVDVKGTVAWVRSRRCGVEFDWETTPSFAKTYLRSLMDDVEKLEERQSRMRR